MTHESHAAPAAPRRVVFDPENVGKVQRLCDATALAESEIKSALAAARCGIVKVPRNYKPVVPPDDVRDWLMLATQRYPTLAVLLQAVSIRCGVSVQEIKSPRRNRKVVRARQIFMALAKFLTSYSFPQIGRACGGKDHSTVMHGCAMVAAKPEYFEPEFSDLRAAFLWDGERT